jgi:hypothetical protein
MPNKYHRQNFFTGGGTSLKNFKGAASQKEIDFLKSLMSGTSKKDIKTPAQKSKKKTFESPMKRQRKLDTLKSEAAKTGGKVMSMDEMQKLKGESDKSYESRMKKAFEAKKGGRAKLRFGGKSNLQKIIETFGPKKTKVKKDKKPKKRMMAKGGSKPDFLDLDKDGNTSESMKSAAKQAKGKNND